MMVNAVIGALVGRIYERPLIPHQQHPDSCFLIIRNSFFHYNSCYSSVIMHMPLYRILQF